MAVAIRARSGLAAFKTVGSGPNLGMISKAGLFDDAALLIQGTEVYTLTSAGVATLIPGSVVAGDAVDIDAGQDANLNSVARVATGSALYKVTTGSAVAEDFPTGGGPGASSVCYIRGYWLASVVGTDQVYYQVPGDTAWTALSFASAEYAPDPVVAIRKLGEQIWLLGSSSSEVWALTGAASPAMQPYGGLNFDFGCRARASAVSMQNALIWVDDASRVQMTQGGAPQVISDHGLVEQIRNTAASDLRASWYQLDGHTYYVLTLGTTATWVYDVATQKWARRSSGTYDFFRFGQFVSLTDRVLCADLLTPAVYEVSPTAWDDAGPTYPVEFSAYAELLEGSIPCVNVELLCEVGDAPRSGQGSDPKIAMKYSDDGGKSWSAWRYRSLGATGQVVRPRWHALGTIKAPYGRLFRFRTSEPVARRFSDVRLNAP